MNDPKIIIAIDQMIIVDLEILLGKLDPQMCRIKIGKSMFTRYGLEPIKTVQRFGFDVFLDLKYHDIPNTVGDAVEAAADHGVWMVNLHAAGGQKMMETARERLVKHDHHPLLIAVTCLTSLDADDLQYLGIMHTPTSYAWGLANAAYECGMDGIVCSPHEVHEIRESHLFDANFMTVVPGIRPSYAKLNDQKRVMTPREAIKEGATYLVIGRPITEAENPIAMLTKISSEIDISQNP